MAAASANLRSRLSPFRRVGPRSAAPLTEQHPPHDRPTGVTWPPRLTMRTNQDDVMGFISRGFKGKRRDNVSSSRVPPGQHVVEDFPVLSAGPTPRVSLDSWTFSIVGEIHAPKRLTGKECH